MEALHEYIGGFGYWQLYLLMLNILDAVPTAMQTFALTFCAPNVDFWCARPESAREIPIGVWKNYSSPLVKQDGTERRSGCQVYDWVYSSNVSTVQQLKQGLGNQTEDCKQWEYDQGIFQRTMVKDFDLVCSRDILISSSNTIYMAGFLVGVLFNGMLADRFGRRKVILISQIICLAVTTVMIFSQSFIMFMILRGVQDLVRVGTATVGFVLFIEMCSERHRASLGNLTNVGSPLGMIAYAGVAYLLLNWKYIQIVTAVELGIIVLMIWATTAFIYYGLSFNTNILAGDPFINFIIGGAIELPAYIYGAAASKYIGRKYTTSFNLIIGGLACFTTIFISQDQTTLKVVFPMIGKFFVSATFGVIYVYTTELFPTMLRSTGLGSCSMVARVGSMLAPFIKELGKQTNPNVPSIVYCSVSVASGLLIQLLPETKNAEIPETIEDLVVKSSNKNTEQELHETTKF